MINEIYNIVNNALQMIPYEILIKEIILEGELWPEYSLRTEWIRMLRLS